MWMGKSLVNMYERCSWSFKLSEIDKKERKPMPVFERGIELHQLLEDWYDTKDIENHPLYKKYEKQAELFKQSTLSQYVPAFRELFCTDPKISLKGTIDRVDIDHQTGKVVVVDYKSGKINSMSKYRFELAVYAWLLLRHEGIEATHWGVYFIDHGKYIEEEINSIDVINALAKIKATREKVLEGKFYKDPKYPCKYCEHFETNCEGVFK